MNTRRGYTVASTAVFALVALFQCLRASNGWPVQINEFAVPVMASWGIAAFAAAMAFWGWRSR